MRIDTKFDIGEKVWFLVHCNSDRWFVVNSEIKAVKIEQNTDCFWEYYYSDTVSADCMDIFRTKKEAEAECANRNGEQ